MFKDYFSEDMEERNDRKGANHCFAVHLQIFRKRSWLIMTQLNLN